MKPLVTFKRLGCAAVSVLLASTVLISPATAAEADPTDSALIELGSLVTEQNVSVEKQGNEFVAESENATVVLPQDPTDAVVLVDDSESSVITVNIPESESVGGGEKSYLGGVTFDNNDESTTTVLPKLDGSVQIATVITSNAAPHDYEYTVTSGEVSSMEFEADGGVSIFDGDGEWKGGVAPPWAKDANGNDVPTSFSIDGNKLIQHVAFTADTIFPVVADPWIGVALISKAVWASNLWKWSPTLKVYPTWWGRNTGAAARWAAWSETLSKTARKGWPNPDTGSMKNQFYCHFDVVRFRAPNKEYWGLDSKLPDRGYWGFVGNSCN